MAKQIEVDVSELRSILSNFDPKDKIIMSRDAEGNGFSKFGSVSKTYYDEELDQEVKACVLWPK